MLKAKFPVVYMAALLSLASACDKSIATDEVEWNNVKIHASISRITPAQAGGSGKALAYGTVRYQGIEGGYGQANLTCLTISTANARSTSIYVDSPAHVLPDRYQAKDGNTIHVYWQMDRVPPEGSKLKLHIAEGCHPIRVSGQ